MKSVPLPPQGYVSPSALRQQSEPPKPFSYRYEGPDPYGGYSSHESQGDDKGRITGQYTVQNPDGTSRLVKYVADPELGFHAEVETDEEGTKTSEPANASIISTAPEEGYQPQAKRASYGSTGAVKNAYGSARNKGASYGANYGANYGAGRSPAPFASQKAQRSPQQTAYRATGQQTYRGSPRRPVSGQARAYNAPLLNSGRYQPPLQQARRASLRPTPRSSALNQPRTFAAPTAGVSSFNNSPLYRGNQPSYRAPQPNYRAPQLGYRAPQPSYRAPQPNYRAPQPNYQTNQATYRATQPSYRANQAAYRGNQPSYRANQPTYAANQLSYRNPTLVSNSLRTPALTGRFIEQNRNANRSNFNG